MMLAPVAVLFARRDSCYFDLAQHVFDEERDATTYRGAFPVVAHPPCRGWGRLRHLSVASDSEKALALFAVDAVRRWGGVLEHPFGSALWEFARLPRAGGCPDQFGGRTLLVRQCWWGHAAPKPTLLYVVGNPRIEFPQGEALLRRPGGATSHLSVRQRESTPLEFARWLVSVAVGSRVDRSIHWAQ